METFCRNVSTLFFLAADAIFVTIEPMRIDRRSSTGGTAFRSERLHDRREDFRQSCTQTGLQTADSQHLESEENPTLKVAKSVRRWISQLCNQIDNGNRAKYGAERLFSSIVSPVSSPQATQKTRLWMPEQVLFTPAALDEPWGQQILSRVKALDLPVELLTKNRITGLRGETERETYAISKRTLAVVNAPPSSLKLSPIPPSADWQFHLAEGCPAHCQYCYLAGSLSGPPVIRAFANLPQTLQHLGSYEKSSNPTSFEVSCYTDPLGIEHLTGSLAACIRYFGTRDDGYLRWVSKFDGVDELLDLPHNGHTRCRFSVNAAPISDRLEGGTASVANRLQALRKLALPRAQGGGSYPVGLVIAPIMPIEDWEEHYTNLFDAISTALDFECDLTFELISHRFTPGSKEVLQSWYPNSKLEMDESKRVVKRNKFGGTKYVYDSTTMKTMRQFFEGQIRDRFPQAKILYWT